MKHMLVVGSVAYDTIHNHIGTHHRVLGGSATFGALAASLVAPVRLVGVVGEDFPDGDVAILRSRGIDIEGLEIAPGKTFHWEGRYSDNLASRESLKTELNVFADFHPKIPERFRDTPYVFLGNIAPELQLEVLEQVRAPELVVADTMNFWIQGKPTELAKVLARVDVLVINEEESRELAGLYNICEVAKELLSRGPRIVIIKRGEYGALLFEGEHVFSAPAYPLEQVADPTGAGDSFAGGFLGYVAHHGSASNDTLRRAVIYGSAVASYCVEGVGVTRLVSADKQGLEERYAAFQRLSRFD
jgi:sugar/nucleoside kinase (ribokinase family)